MAEPGGATCSPLAFRRGYWHWRSQFQKAFRDQWDGGVGTDALGATNVRSKRKMSNQEGRLPSSSRPPRCQAGDQNVFAVSARPRRVHRGVCGYHQWQLGGDQSRHPHNAGDDHRFQGSTILHHPAEGLFISGIVRDGGAPPRSHHLDNSCQHRNRFGFATTLITNCRCHSG